MEEEPLINSQDLDLDLQNLSSENSEEEDDTKNIEFSLENSHFQNSKMSLNLYDN